MDRVPRGRWKYAKIARVGGPPEFNITRQVRRFEWVIHRCAGGAGCGWRSWESLRMCDNRTRAGNPQY